MSSGLFPLFPKLDISDGRNYDRNAAKLAIPTNEDGDQLMNEGRRLC